MLGFSSILSLQWICGHRKLSGSGNSTALVCSDGSASREEGLGLGQPFADPQALSHALTSWGLSHNLQPSVPSTYTRHFTAHAEDCGGPGHFLLEGKERMRFAGPRGWVLTPVWSWLSMSGALDRVAARLALQLPLGPGQPRAPLSRAAALAGAQLRARGPQSERRGGHGALGDRAGASFRPPLRPAEDQWAEPPLRHPKG